MLNIATINLNGIRSAWNKGFYGWLIKQDFDIVCFQELKAQYANLSNEMLRPLQWQAYYKYADKKGYSGVGLWSKLAPQRVIDSMGVDEFDQEGRYLQADFKTFSVVSLYLPSGSASSERQASKYRFLDAFLPQLQRMRQSGREWIICGDWNIAHQPIDLKNWRSNQKNSGFLPEERAWLSHIFDDIGFVDVFRRLDPRPEQYTWWSHRGRARANHVGWRIDYQIATPAIAALAQSTAIYSEPQFSDHALLEISYQDRDACILG